MTSTSGGPRLCIGQRFAMVEMKIAMVKVLSKYRILATPNTKIEFEGGTDFVLCFTDFEIEMQKL